MNFETLGLRPRLIAALSEAGITRPTPIQQQAIPHALEGRDVLGLAQTGTGKTAAFGLPMIEMLMQRGHPPAKGTATGLILAPTRELAKQIADALTIFTKGAHLKVAVVVGGASINRQTSKLGRGVDLLIATPGRLIDLLDRQALTLSSTRFLVLDEADQMLDLGFIHALRKIAPLLPDTRQTMMFSATMPKLMADLSAQFLTDPIRVEVARPGLPADKIAQSVHFVADHKVKPEMLEDLLSRHTQNRALVFLRTKHGAERLKKRLVAAGFAADSIHGNKSQGQRSRALQAFRDGEVKVLVATDVAARGIDIPDVKFVYNYDLPNVAENYVHRIGRTARAGASGQAIAFCAPDETSDLRAIEKVLKVEVPTASGERILGTAPAKPARRRRGGKLGGKPRAGNGADRNAADNKARTDTASKPKVGAKPKSRSRTPNRNKRRRMKRAA